MQLVRRSKWKNYSEKNMISQFKESNLSWQKALRIRSFRLQLLITTIGLCAVLIFIPQFFLFIQSRNGIVINDELLNILTPQNFSTAIFVLIYSTIVVAVFSFYKFPVMLLRVLQCYLLLTFLRIISIWLVPLNAPSGYIDLVDPFIGRFAYAGNYIDKDLFFSGHVSILFLIFLFEERRWLKIIFMLSTFLVAAFLLKQHVHYSIDILAAPLFALSCYRLWKIADRNSFFRI